MLSLLELKSSTRLRNTTARRASTQSFPTSPFLFPLYINDEMSTSLVPPTRHYSGLPSTCFETDNAFLFLNRDPCGATYFLCPTSANNWSDISDKETLCSAEINLIYYKETRIVRCGLSRFFARLFTAPALLGFCCIVDSHSFE